MRIATIDCGTNTVLLLVAEVSLAGQGRPRAVPIEERLEITRLGQGLDQSGVLREDAMARTLAALCSHAERARALGASRVVAVGTESLRAAKNGGEFLARAAQAGVPIRVLSGAEEAQASFRSVVESLPPPPGGSWSVLDIGGGSTELIVGRRAPEEARSVPIGSVRLTERLLRHDPPTADERAALHRTIDEALDALPAPRGALCGLAGTVTTVAALHLRMERYERERIDGLRLPVAAIAAQVERLAGLSLAERRGLAGLDPRRADVIYAGAEILYRVALRAGVDEVTVSDRGVRWGVLESLIDELATT